MSETYKTASADPDRARRMENDAVSYFLAAQKLLHGESDASILVFLQMPVNFLIAQCCELVLKSLLSARGWDKKRLHLVRHDLEELARIAGEEGIALDPGFIRYCKIMRDPHRNFDFRYSGAQGPAFINPFVALAMIKPQIEANAHHGVPAPSTAS